MLRERERRSEYGTRHLEESAGIGLFQRLDAELHERRGVLQVVRAAGHLCAQVAQLGVALAARELHERLLAPPQRLDQLAALRVDRRLDLRAALLQCNRRLVLDSVGRWRGGRLTCTRSVELLSRWMSSVAFFAFSDNCCSD